MKVIDLLNKIANGEELPRKLKGNNHTYTGIEDLNYQLCNYQDEDGDILFSDDYEWCSQRILNKELEIIEEEKDIEELAELNIRYKGGTELVVNEKIMPEDIEEELALKINELIKEVNKLKNKGE